MAELERSDWSDIGQDSSNENKRSDIRNSGSIDMALRL